MELFRITYLCPECGMIHEWVTRARNPFDAHSQFVDMWGLINMSLNVDIQLPLCVIERIKPDAS